MFSIREGHGAMRVNAEACTKLALPDLVPRFSVHLGSDSGKSLRLAMLQYRSEVRCFVALPGFTLLHIPPCDTQNVSLPVHVARGKEIAGIFPCGTVLGFSPAVFHKRPS